MNPDGLSSAEAAARLAAEGSNRIAASERRGSLAIAAEVIREPMLLLLLAAAGLYLAVGDRHEALVLGASIMVVIAITVLQERKAERALEALRDLSSPRALVVRDGQRMRIAVVRAAQALASSVEWGSMSVTVLLPFDGSPAAQNAIAFLAAYAGDKPALSAVLLNVQQRPMAFWPEASPMVGAIESALLEEGARVLAPASSRLEAAGIAARREVRLGLAAQTVLHEAKANAAGLIVMGTRGAGILHGYALGSVALRVAHGGAAPVILVKPQDRLPGALGKRLRVLVAMDGSEPALRAVRRLLDWRAWLGELEVHLVHVQRPLTTLEAVLPPHDDLVRQWSNEEAEQATKTARELLQRAGVSPHLHLSVGDTALEVRQIAEHTAAELVVLGTRGLGAAHHALIGSVALKAAAALAVPVLLVA